MNIFKRKDIVQAIFLGNILNTFNDLQLIINYVPTEIQTRLIEEALT